MVVVLVHTSFCTTVVDVGHTCSLIKENRRKNNVTGSTRAQELMVDRDSFTRKEILRYERAELGQSPPTPIFSHTNVETVPCWEPHDVGGDMKSKATTVPTTTLLDWIHQPTNKTVNDIWGPIISCISMNGVQRFSCFLLHLPIAWTRQLEANEDESSMAMDSTSMHTKRNL